MKTFRTKPPGIVSKLGAIALSALALAWLPQAEANTSEGATIENIATVSWEDSDGNPDSTTAYVQVTVSLATNAPLLSGRPVDAGAQRGAQNPLPGAQAVLSGATASYLYAITATANGQDTYDLSGIQTDATSGVSGVSISWQLKAADGTTDVGAADPASVILGAAVVAEVTSATQLSFPGGSLSGFAVNDIVVIGNNDFRISAITPGNAPDHGTTPTPTAEVLDIVTFAINAVGGNVTPDFTGATPVAVGDVVGEQQLLEVSVTATVSAPPTAGTVNHDVVVDTSTGGQTAEDQDKQTTFNPGPVITVTKYVRNVLNAAGNSGGTGGTTINAITYYTGGVTGNPGDTLEYVIVVANATGAGQASNVVISDPIPAYTSYVSGSLLLDNDTLADGSTSAGWPAALNDGENSGDAGEYRAANTTVYIYAGSGGSDADAGAPPYGTGGTLAGGSYTFGAFRVTID